MCQPLSIVRLICTGVVPSALGLPASAFTLTTASDFLAWAWTLLVTVRVIRHGNNINTEARPIDRRIVRLLRGECGLHDTILRRGRTKQAQTLFKALLPPGPLPGGRCRLAC